MKMVVKESERFDLIKRLHRQAPPGTEYGVGKWEVDWLIDEVEKCKQFREALKEIAENPNASTDYGYAQEVARKALGGSLPM